MEFRKNVEVAATKISYQLFIIYFIKVASRKGEIFGMARADKYAKIKFTQVECMVAAL